MITYAPEPRGCNCVGSITTHPPMVGEHLNYPTGSTSGKKGDDRF